MRDRSWIVVAVAVLLIAGGAITQYVRSRREVVVVLDDSPVVRTAVPAVSVPHAQVDCAEGARRTPDGKLEYFTSCR